MSEPPFPPAKYRLKFENKMCKMCQTCAAVCSLNKWGETSTSLGAFHLDIDFYTADVNIDFCKQCVSPSCAIVCPKDAIQYNEQRGVMETDVEKCNGCTHCVTACPVGAISYNRHLKKASKCNMCGLCVEFCPGDAISIVEVTKYGREKTPAVKEKTEATP